MNRDMKFSGKVWKFGDDVDTDAMTGSGGEMEKIYHWNDPIEKCSLRTFNGIRPEFSTTVQKGDIIVAGKNFGCGSSRELAPEWIHYLGVSCIIAKSFARIFYRNAFNDGMILIECPDAPDICEEGDILTVEINRRISVNGKEYPIPKIPDNLLKIYEDSGMVRRMVNLNKEMEQENKEIPYPVSLAGKKLPDRPMTLAEKLILKNSPQQDGCVGDIVTVYPSCVQYHDIYTADVERKFRDMKFKKVWDPDKVVVVLDHTSPQNASSAARAINSAFDFAKEMGITRVHHGKGIDHSLMHELGYAVPGTISIVTDSHTTTYGGGGCLGTGVGYTEMASILGTGEIWLKIPKAIKVVLDGVLPEGVYAKDFILKLLGDIRADGGQYKSLEFTGEAIRAMSMSARYTIANMALEAGAKCALFEADEKTAEYFHMPYEEISWIHMDEDAVYEKVLYYNASQLEPQLACPGGVDNVTDLKQVEGTPLTQVVIGSCTNSSLEDIAIAADIMRGRHVPPYLRFYVSTATAAVMQNALKLGYVEDLVKAGAVFGAPTCQSCCGMVARMGDDDVCLGTNNRNFLGRHGTIHTKLYLGSPAAAAASALNGCITDPRDYIGRPLPERKEPVSYAD